MFQFTYDAWNRLVKVTKAYRDPDDSYNLKADMVVNTLEYDGLHRRASKAVANSGPLDCTYHYYYNGQQIVETHNGSEQVIQQFVWGQTYIDELIQIGLNDDPADATEQDVETFRFAMHNANFNVQGLVDENGGMVERYEYTPYGERQVYTSAGLNDPDCYAPIKKSKRVQVAGVDQPWGLNPVGHQGLFHDEETRLVYNRARMLHPRLGRFMQRDPLRYVDGMNIFEYLGGNPVRFIDPWGLVSVGIYDPDDPGGKDDKGEKTADGKCFKNAADDFDYAIPAEDIFDAAFKLQELVDSGVQVDELYIIDHGTEGTQDIGNGNISPWSPAWAMIGGAIKPGGTVYLLGCNVAGIRGDVPSDNGELYLQMLANFGNVKVVGWTGITDFWVIEWYFMKDYSTSGRQVVKCPQKNPGTPNEDHKNREDCDCDKKNKK